MQIGEGRHPELKKWPAYKEWNYDNVCTPLQRIKQARNVLNHNQVLCIESSGEREQAMDVADVVQAIEYIRDVLQELKMDSSKVEVWAVEWGWA